jgi:exo-beta-1,3-glucanase (GH17 family)
MLYTAKLSVLTGGLMVVTLVGAGGAAADNGQAQAGRNGAATVRGLDASSGIIRGLSFSPYRYCQGPKLGIHPTAEQMRQDVLLASETGNSLRTYSSRNGMNGAAEFALDRGMRVSIGVWLDKDLKNNRKEIESAVRFARAHPDLHSVIVGNEVLYHRYFSQKRLVSYITEVRRRIPRSVKVTSAEVAKPLRASKQVMAAVDYQLVHIHPYWDKRPVAGAARYVAEIYGRVKKTAKRYRGKAVVIGETGWPSGGPAFGAAVPGPENARRFLYEWKLVANEKKIPYYLFSLSDEPWKKEGSAGPHWGILDADRRPKHDIVDLFSQDSSQYASPPSQSDGSRYPIYTNWGEQDNYYPSGWMGDTDSVVTDDCWVQNSRNGAGTSLRFSYDVRRSTDQGWAGVYFLLPGVGWGTRPGGRDLSPFHTLTFHARGELGGEVITFVSHGVVGPYGDSAPKSEITVTLTDEWKQYSIDLRGRDLTRVVGAFGWSASSRDNPNGAGFQVDDIEYRPQSFSLAWLRETR